MKTYKIVFSMGDIKEVQGTPIKLFPWVETFVHKINKSFQICETTTGLSICSSLKRKDAVAKAIEMLTEIGEEKTKAQVAKAPKINKII